MHTTSNDPMSLDAMQLDRGDHGGDQYDPFFQKNLNVTNIG